MRKAAGFMYAPTASKNGANTNANTPVAIAETVPTKVDLKNKFTGVPESRSRS
jgi:hypothetical protein